MKGTKGGKKKKNQERKKRPLGEKSKKKEHDTKKLLPLERFRYFNPKGNIYQESGKGPQKTTPQERQP